jgi:hypothetical protein
MRCARHNPQARGLAQLLLCIVLTTVSIERASDCCHVLSNGFAYSWFLKRESAILTSPTAKLQLFFPNQECHEDTASFPSAHGNYPQHLNVRGDPDAMLPRLPQNVHGASLN